MEILGDVNLIERLISTLGFPIVLVAYLLWDRSKAQARYDRIFARFNASIEGNTKVMYELVRKMDGEK